MKKKPFLVKARENPLLVAIIIAITLLLVANAFLLLSPTKKPLSLYKKLTNAKHLELVSVFNEIESNFPGKRLLDENTIESTYLYYLYSSMLEDAHWFKAKELETFNKTMKANSNEEGRNGLIEEVAIELVFQNALLLNGYSAEGELWKYYDERYEEEISNAVQMAKELNAENFLELYVNEELLKEAMLKKENIENAAKKIMSEYIELRKQAFESALLEENKVKAFVEANKIVGLYELCVGPQ